MYQLSYDIAGKDCGDFRYSRMDQLLFLERLKREMASRGIKKIFAPQCQFTTRIAKFGSIEDDLPVTTWFIRTQSKADGGVVIEPNIAVAILNADCPVVILFDPWLGYLVMLHAGFRCLVPKDPGTPSIIESAFQDFHLRPNKIQAVVGFGAGSCCYGIDHIDDLKKQEYAPYIRKILKGPRVGQRSLDLYGLIRQKLINADVRTESITINETCTACAGQDNLVSQYHSNIYEGDSAGRNLVLAWFSRNPKCP